MSWRTQIERWLGSKPKPKAKPASAKKSAPADSPRAKMIAEARRIHKAVGTQIRADIANSITELQNAGPKTLRDPEALGRLMSLIQAQRTMASLMRHDLRRYLVITGLRQWLGESGEPPAPQPKPRVVRR